MHEAHQVLIRVLEDIFRALALHRCAHKGIGVHTSEQALVDAQSRLGVGSFSLRTGCYFYM